MRQGDLRYFGSSLGRCECVAHQCAPSRSLQSYANASRTSVRITNRTRSLYQSHEALSAELTCASGHVATWRRARHCRSQVVLTSRIHRHVPALLRAPSYKSAVIMSSVSFCFDVTRRADEQLVCNKRETWPGPKRGIRIRTMQDRSQATAASTQPNCSTIPSRQGMTPQSVRQHHVAARAISYTATITLFAVRQVHKTYCQHNLHSHAQRPRRSLQGKL